MWRNQAFKLTSIKAKDDGLYYWIEAEGIWSHQNNCVPITKQVADILIAVQQHKD